jgi:hypothetical protein
VATGEQLKALVKIYIDGDEARFVALALPRQILYGSTWQKRPQDAAMLTSRVHAKTPPKRWS